MAVMAVIRLANIVVFSLEVQRLFMFAFMSWMVCTSPDARSKLPDFCSPRSVFTI